MYHQTHFFTSALYKFLHYLSTAVDIFRRLCTVAQMKSNNGSLAGATLLICYRFLSLTCWSCKLVGTGSALFTLFIGVMNHQYRTWMLTLFFERFHPREKSVPWFCTIVEAGQRREVVQNQQVHRSSSFGFIVEPLTYLIAVSWATALKGAAKKFFDGKFDPSGTDAYTGRLN